MPHSILRRDSHGRFVECGIRRLARGTVLVARGLAKSEFFVQSSSKHPAYP